MEVSNPWGYPYFHHPLYMLHIYIYTIYIYIYTIYIYIYNIFIYTQYIYTIYMSMKKMFILMKETIQLLQYPHDYGSFPLFFTVNSALFAAHQFKEISRSRGFRQKAEEHHHLLVLNGKNHGISMESYKLMVFNGISHIFDVSISAYIYIYTRYPPKKKNDVFEVATLLGQITLFSLSSSWGYHILYLYIYISIYI